MVDFDFWIGDSENQSRQTNRLSVALEVHDSVAVLSRNSPRVRVRIFVLIGIDECKFSMTTDLNPSSAINRRRFPELRPFLLSACSRLFADQFAMQTATRQCSS